MIQIVGEKVPLEFFTGLTVQGHKVIFAYNQPVAAVLNNGGVYKRLKYCQGRQGLKVDVALAGVTGPVFELSEQEWGGLVDVITSPSFMPPPVEVPRGLLNPQR